MPLYHIDGQSIAPLKKVTFSQQQLRERSDLQQLLKSRIEVIAPDTLVVSEEFCEWDDSRLRIDLLAIDKNANLVVIELKRTEDGGHMELQALRYAAMISTLTFERLVAIYAAYLEKEGSELVAQNSLLQFLEWAEPDEDQFAQEVRIVLASAEFSKELTTTVMWLNEFGLDIRCVRMHPYEFNSKTILDVQTVIPIPEMSDYQVKVRAKKQKEREARNHARDFSKFDLAIAGNLFPTLNKRGLMFQLVSEILKNGGTPPEVDSAIPWRQLFAVFEGTLSAEEIHTLLMAEDGGGQVPRAKRFFCKDGQPFHHDGKSYALSNQWGDGTLEAVVRLAEKYPALNISVAQSAG